MVNGTAFSYLQLSWRLYTYITEVLSHRVSSRMMYGGYLISEPTCGLISNCWSSSRVSQFWQRKMWLHIDTAKTCLGNIANFCRLLKWFLDIALTNHPFLESDKNCSICYRKYFKSAWFIAIGEGSLLFGGSYGLLTLWEVVDREDGGLPMEELLPSSSAASKLKKR